MFRLRVIPVFATLVMGLSLSACSGTSGNFNPIDWISADWLSSKAPLPGERKPVFPNGVPGVPEGVPKELVKGSQQQQQAVTDATAPPEEEPAPAAKPAPKPQAAKPAPKPRTASAPPQPAPQPAPQNTQSDWPQVNPNTSSR